MKLKKMFPKCLPQLTKCVNFTKDDIVYRKYYFLGKILYLKKENAYDYKKTYFLNICISNKKLKTKINKNTYNLTKIFSFENSIDTNNKIDIIIPIYNGYEYLENLFNTIKDNTDLDYRLIVVNDKSSDTRILPLLEKYNAIFSSKMLLINNEENLGFVKSVNKALKVSTENVVLLNSDVIVPKNWSSRLIAPIIKNEKIASVTPFSDAATIFSLPENCKDNEFNENLQVVDNELSKISIDSDILNFPTGVGYCMAMNKKAIQEIGFFDEVFERGYGEENDWCQRAIEKGYLNTIAANLFLWHKHGGSFDNEEKQKLISQHLKIVTKKHPNYFKDVDDLLNNENYKSLRFWAELLYIKAISIKNQVWFDHTWGGGTETYTFNKIEELKNQALIVRVQNNGGQQYCISYYYKEYTNQIIVQSLTDIETIILQLMPDLIVVNNLASYIDILVHLDFIESLKAKYNFKISFRGHDFQCICPSITMVNHEHKYCNCKNITDFPKCFSEFKKTPIKINSIEEWQAKWFHFISNVTDEIVVFSNSTKEVFLTFYPDIAKKIIVIPHNVKLLRKVDVLPHKRINIGVLGSIGIDKGLLILQDIDKLLPSYPNIKVKVIGTCKKKHIKNIKVLGEYKVENLPDIVEKENIDIILIPSIWPETFSYTTGEAMSMGVPVACFNLGAPAERNNEGCIISEITAKNTLEEISSWWNKKEQSYES